MSSVINTNVKSLVAQNALSVNNRSLNKAMEQLSTGKRINSAADDAAGLAISNKMTAQIRGLNQAVRNANDAISVAQTAEGATTEISNMLQRMRELAVQSANDSNSDDDRDALQAEVDALVDEIDRVASDTEFNDSTLLTTEADLSFQIGSGSGQTVEVTFQSMTTATLDVDALDITTSSASATAMTTIDTAIATVDSFRADLGATINRFNYAIDNMSNISMNTAASRSRIQDADYAASTTELARAQIIQQAATAMLAQANQQPQSVLSLLQ